MTQTKPLTPLFGVEVTDTPLKAFTDPARFPELRALFDEHSALLFRGQDFSDDDHLALARLFGPIEDRLADERDEDEDYVIPKVSNVTATGTLSDELDLHTLHLKANFLWHADSTFLPVPALTNILIARVVTEEGGATELASTRAAWAEMPEALKSRIEGRGIWHHYSHSRRRISPELAELPMFNKWPAQHWKALWTNPVNGKEALYIASHAYKVDGLDDAESAVLLDELIAFCTRSNYKYTHQWQENDVLVWDQRAVLHRGTPWDMSKPRTLSSLCCSVCDDDGLAEMRIAP